MIEIEDYEYGKDKFNLKVMRLLKELIEENKTTENST